MNHKEKKNETSPPPQKKNKTKRGKPRCSRRVRSFCLLQDTHRVAHIVKFGERLADDTGKTGR